MTFQTKNWYAAEIKLVEKMFYYDCPDPCQKTIAARVTAGSATRDHWGSVGGERRVHAGGRGVGGALNRLVHWRSLVRVVEVGPVGRVLAVATSVVFASWALPRFYWRVHASGRGVAYSACLRGCGLGYSACAGL